MTLEEYRDEAWNRSEGKTTVAIAEALMDIAYHLQQIKQKTR